MQISRRTFLRSMAALGVAAAVAEKALLASPPQQLRVLAEDWISLSSIQISGMEEASRPVSLILQRRDSGAGILNLCFNAHQGMFLWVAPLGGEIILTREHPVTLITPFNGSVILSGCSSKDPGIDAVRKGDFRWVKHIFTSRERRPWTLSQDKGTKLIT